jgi:hypothetical protein
MIDAALKTFVETRALPRNAFFADSFTPALEPPATSSG